MIINKHYRKGYMSFEELPLMILEQYGIGFYHYRKEVEIITQTLKAIFKKGLKEDSFDVNDIPGCSIPFTNNVYVQTDYNFNGSYGEYVPEYLLEKDEYGMPILPAPDKDDNYDYETGQIKEAYILIHFDPSVEFFDEVKYRQVIAHEIVHLRDDYEIRRVSKNELSLLRDFVSDNMDYAYVMDMMDYGNRNAHILYRLFIDTEWHVLSSQIYMDLYNLYKSKDCHMERRNATSELKETETFKIYETLRDDYKMLIKTPNFGNIMIKFFPKWLDKFEQYRDEKKKRQDILDAFKRWFQRVAETRLKTVFNRMVKVCGIFYNDIENTDDYAFENYKKNYYESIKIINESIKSYGAAFNIHKDEYIPVFTVSENQVVPLTIKYNKLFEHV